MFDLGEIDRLLTTTRSVRRRLHFERPVEMKIVYDCLRISQQAPTASNQQTWRWILVDDDKMRSDIAEIYRECIPAMEANQRILKLNDQQTQAVYDSACWLAERLGSVPVLAFPCVIDRPPEWFSPVLNSSIYGSIFPAIWSFQLALRSRGLGSVLTTLHLLREDEVNGLLNIPKGVLSVAMIPLAYTKGTDFQPARRVGVENIVFRNHWESGV